MPARIYIGKLSDSARERDVERFFRSYGRVCDIVLKNGYGFVEFEDERDADDAVYDLNGKELCGERVKLEHARGATRRTNNSAMRARPTWLDKYGAPVRTGYRLTVQNLSSRVSWQDLKDHMRQAGEVTYADAHKECKNEGVVEFATYGDMKNALVKLDGMEINGRKIKLVEDKPKSRRRRSSSRSRSRSLSRSRSRSRRHSRKSRSRSKSPRKRSPSSRKTKSLTPRDDHSRSPPDAKTLSNSISRSPKKSRSSARHGSDTPQKSRSRSAGKSPRGPTAERDDSRSQERSESHGKYRGLERRHSESASRSPSPMHDGRNDSSDED